MERYESPTIEPVGGGEADPKSVVPIALLTSVVFNIAVAQAIVEAFIVVYTVEVKVK